MSALAAGHPAFTQRRAQTDQARRERLLRVYGPWVGMVAFLGALHLFIVFVGAGLQDDPRSQLFDWPAIGIIGALGLIGVALADRTGFPAAWDASISNRQRWAVPLAVGAALGLCSVVHEQLFHSTQWFIAEHGSSAFNAPWPGSPLFYTGGAIFVEVAFRLLPIPLLLWLISSVALRGRWQTPIFWVLAALTSLLEPSTQDLAELGSGIPMAMLWTLFAIDYVENFTQAAFFRKYGLVASVAVRLGMYLVWHVGYGNFVCHC
jgi:hypothetical protein